MATVKFKRGKLRVTASWGDDAEARAAHGEPSPRQFQDDEFGGKQDDPGGINSKDGE